MGCHADRSPPSTVEVKKDGPVPILCPYAFLAWIGTTLPFR